MMLSHTSIFTMCLCVTSLCVLWCSVIVLHKLCKKKKKKKKVKLRSTMHDAVITKPPC